MISEVGRYFLVLLERLPAGFKGGDEAMNENQGDAGSISVVRIVFIVLR